MDFVDSISIQNERYICAVGSNTQPTVLDTILPRVEDILDRNLQTEVEEEEGFDSQVPDSAENRTDQLGGAIDNQTSEPSFSDGAEPLPTSFLHPVSQSSQQESPNTPERRKRRCSSLSQSATRSSERLRQKEFRKGNNLQTVHEDVQE